MQASTENEHFALPLHALRRFLRERAFTHTAEEHCHMCNAPLAGEHRHMLDPVQRSALCACDACALLFAPGGAGNGKYRLIPRRVLALPDFQITDEQWNELMLPVNMVYLFRSTEAGRALAFYPSPAGAMESLLNLEHWETLVEDNPILNDLEPDVEALLINRVKLAREYYLVPIDMCYRLVGLLRTSWKGLSGGAETWEAIAAFFAKLQSKASHMSADHNRANQRIDQPDLDSENPQGDDNVHA